jgi:hypothetical protein
VGGRLGRNRTTPQTAAFSAGTGFVCMFALPFWGENKRRPHDEPFRWACQAVRSMAASACT